MCGLGGFTESSRGVLQSRRCQHWLVAWRAHSRTRGRCSFRYGRRKRSAVRVPSFSKGQKKRRRALHGIISEERFLIGRGTLIHGLVEFPPSFYERCFCPLVSKLYHSRDEVEQGFLIAILPLQEYHHTCFRMGTPHMEMGSIVLATSKSRVDEHLPPNFGQEIEIFPLSH